MMNKRAMRIVLNDYSSSYMAMLSAASIPSLHEGRLKSMIIESFKCIKDISPSFLQEYFIPSTHSYNTRGGIKMIQPKVSSTSMLKSFSYQGPKLWNLLPADLKNADTICKFKYGIKKWTRPACHCGNCIECKIVLL